MSKTRRIAAIDIGTVTTRLLVADVSDDGLTEVARSTDITHLGEGLTATGRLSDAAMQRVSDVIARYAATMRELGVERFTAMATSASRDAENSAEFLELLAAHGVDAARHPRRARGAALVRRGDQRHGRRGGPARGRPRRRLDRADRGRRRRRRRRADVPRS